MNSYVKNLNGYDENEVAKKIDDEFAVLKDGTRLRISERSTLIKGDIIKSDYADSVYKIESISKHKVYGLDTYSTVMMLKEDKHKKNYNYYYFNELVFSKGRILKLFVANDDKVFLIEKAKELETDLNAFI